MILRQQQQRCRQCSLTLDSGADASFRDLPMMDRPGTHKLLVVDALDDDASHGGVGSAAGLSPPSSAMHAGRP